MFLNIFPQGNMRPMPVAARIEPRGDGQGAVFKQFIFSASEYESINIFGKFRFCFFYYAVDIQFTF